MSLYTQEGRGRDGYHDAAEGHHQTQSCTKESLTRLTALRAGRANEALDPGKHSFYTGKQSSVVNEVKGRRGEAKDHQGAFYLL